LPFLKTLDYSPEQKLNYETNSTLSD